MLFLVFLFFCFKQQLLCNKSELMLLIVKCLSNLCSGSSQCTQLALTGELILFVIIKNSCSLLLIDVWTTPHRQRSWCTGHIHTNSEQQQCRHWHTHRSVYGAGERLRRHKRTTTGGVERWCARLCATYDQWGDDAVAGTCCLWLVEPNCVLVIGNTRCHVGV